MKKYFRFPTSMTKIHEDIIEQVEQIDTRVSHSFKSLQIDEFKKKKSSKQSLKILSDFLNTNNQREEKMESNDFYQIIDVINNAFYGRNSPLKIFLLSQESGLNLIDLSESSTNKTKAKEIGEIKHNFTIRSISTYKDGKQFDEQSLYCANNDFLINENKNNEWDENEADINEDFDTVSMQVNKPNVSENNFHIYLGKNDDDIMDIFGNNDDNNNYTNLKI